MLKDMVGRFMRVHLINGTHVDGADSDEDLIEHAADDIEEFKDYLKDMMKSSGDDGWQINLTLPSGGWCVFPRSSVLWVEFVGFGADV